MQYRITHITEYSYGLPVTVSHSALHMHPREVANQKWDDFELTVTPRPDVMVKREDYYGNHATYITVQQPHTKMIVKAMGTVHVQARQPLLENMSRPWDQVCACLSKDLSADGLDAYQYAFDSPLVGGLAELEDYTRQSFTPGRPIHDAAKDLTHRIFADFKFDPTSTTVWTSVKKVFEQRSGVCQDFAHLMIACLRTLDLPARYVSGYLQTLPAPGKPRLIGADATHAWASVYCPDQGWIDFDPTNSQVVNDQHITLAWGRDFSDVSPVMGVVLGGGMHQVKVSVDVEPIHSALIKPIQSQVQSQSQSQQTQQNQQGQQNQGQGQYQF